MGAPLAGQVTARSPKSAISATLRVKRARMLAYPMMYRDVLRVKKLFHSC
jgi:hypothetical protein